MIDYEKINLLELRIHARNIGVRRPTCLKKEQLINEIKNIENGLSTPFSTKRGRPPKTERIEDKNKKEKFC